jgi:hypothetical protein
MTGRTAWGDESFDESSGGGVYVLAAAVFESAVEASVRESMVRLLGRRKADKLHWHEMDHRQRLQAVAQVRALSGFYVVAVGTPVPRRRQERARVACLAAVVGELHGFAVELFHMESRGPQLDVRDVEVVKGARFALPRGSSFHISHVLGVDEPLTWVADIVAGACRAGRQGKGTYRDILGKVVIDFDVMTGC